MELEAALYEQVLDACTEGDQLAGSGDYRAAIAAYNVAWELLPDPKKQWGASTWVLAAIADAGFLGGFLTTARQALDFVMICPDALGNPFLHLRRGEVLLEQGEDDEAAQELMRAFMSGGEELFAAEDPKYLEFLRSRAVI